MVRDHSSAKGEASKLESKVKNPMILFGSKFAKYCAKQAQ